MGPKRFRNVATVFMRVIFSSVYNAHTVFDREWKKADAAI